ncbi:ribonuclease H1-like [Panonychus citri]|uniref:ribonuclease H1-like n=1 Tax=Panonychus citri TaxID=50023 RepID=UPI002306DD19|nr:ribonuclease H1-like [Panonychus citri]
MITNRLTKLLRRSIHQEVRHAIVYIDGSCINNGQQNARAGIGIYWGPDDERNLSIPLKGSQTSSRAELNAALWAIRQAKEQNFSSLTLRTDSEYLVNSTTKWIDKWKENGWKAQNGLGIKNKDVIFALIKALKTISVTFEKIPGHSGDAGNDGAHKLAKQAATLAYQECKLPV